MHILFPYMARFKAVNWTRYHHLFTQLAAMGHRITVLQVPPAPLTETNFQEIDIDLPEEIRLIDVAMPDFFWRRRWPLDKLVRKGAYSLACHGEVRRILVEDPPTALLVYNLPQAGMLRLEPPPGHRLVRIFDLADDYEAVLRTELGRLALPPILARGRRLLGRMLGEADLVLTVSHSLAETYPNHDIRVLPNGVDLGRFAAERKSRPASAAAPVVGYLGAFEYFIDFDLILDLAARMPDLHFRLVGGGRLFESVKADVRARGLANVELPGPVPFNSVPAEISRMDICLNVFRPIAISHKACPMKLFEYLAMGKPVLTTRLDEIGRYGLDFLHEADSAAEAEQVLRAILADPADASARAARGLDWVAGGYDWSDLAGRLVDWIESTARRLT